MSLQVEIAEDSRQGALGDISLALDHCGEVFVGWIPPDFMGTRPLPDKLATESSQLLR